MRSLIATSWKIFLRFSFAKTISFARKWIDGRFRVWFHGELRFTRCGATGSSPSRTFDDIDPGVMHQQPPTCRLSCYWASCPVLYLGRQGSSVVPPWHLHSHHQRCRCFTNIRLHFCKTICTYPILSCSDWAECCWRLRSARPNLWNAWYSTDAESFLWICYSHESQGSWTC